MLLKKEAWPCPLVLWGVLIVFEYLGRPIRLFTKQIFIEYLLNAKHCVSEKVVHRSFGGLLWLTQVFKIGFLN